MKKKNQTKKKLSLKKLQIAKISNQSKILGGQQNIDNCNDPNGASNHQGGFDTGR